MIMYRGLFDEIIVLMVCVSHSAIIPQQHTGIQSYSVAGRLFCGTQPAPGVRVKLVDDDFGSDPDDDLDAGYTDQHGYFKLSGFTNEMTTIDPHLPILIHVYLKPCQRRWKFELPNHYITNGKVPQRALDIGTWNLEAIMPDESHDCIH